MAGATHLWIRAPNWVGDLVMSTPILHAALRSGSFTKVSIGVRAHLAEVLVDGPLEPHLVRIPKSSSEEAILQDLRPTHTLLLSNSQGAAWRAFRAGVPVRVGSALGLRRFLLTHPVSVPSKDGRRIPYPTRHLMARLAGAIGIEVDPEAALELHVSGEVQEKARARLEGFGLEKKEPYCVSAPSAAFGAAKAWPPEHHAAFLDEMHERFGWRGVLCGAPGEEAVLGAVARAARHPVIDLSSGERTLSLLKAWIQGARLVVSSDSGPRWVSGAFGVPCVALIGPNFPGLTPPLQGSALVRLEGLECSPCIQRTCPLDHHRCMRELHPKLAIEAALKLVSHRPSP